MSKPEEVIQRENEEIESPKPSDNAQQEGGNLKTEGEGYGEDTKLAQGNENQTLRLWKSRLFFTFFNESIVDSQYYVSISIQLVIQYFCRLYSIVGYYRLFGASPVAQTVKNLPMMQKTQVQSLGWEDTLEKGMATQSSILDWRIPWTEEPGGL